LRQYKATCSRAIRNSKITATNTKSTVYKNNPYIVGKTSMRLTILPAAPAHITYRLHGSIPNLPLSRLHAAHRLRRTKIQLAIDRARANGEREVLRELIEYRTGSDRLHYVGYERLLHDQRSGAFYLDSTAAKQVVLGSWHHLARRAGIDLYAISVMGNHVHVIAASSDPDALVDLDRVLTVHKRFTATELNRLHDTPGRRVWAEKEYSRIVRHGGLEQAIWYVLNNPVKAGLTTDPLRWAGNWWAPALWEGYIRPRVA
jgi:REP element-mobilizing transposase RayT